MSYKINLPEFDGPLDLLLHLIKKENINIQDIDIEKITKQYLDYINNLEKLNLNIASEYLVMAAELIEIKSSSLLPSKENLDDEFEEDAKEKLIKKLLDYEQYKNITGELKKLEEFRSEIYTREPNNLLEYSNNDEIVDYGVNLNDLIHAFQKFMEQKQLDKPLNTKVTNKEYNINIRRSEIKNILKKKNKVNFTELFNYYSKDYLVITFLAILSMSRDQEIEIEQENNFKNIIINRKGDF